MFAWCTKTPRPETTAQVIKINCKTAVLRMTCSMVVTTHRQLLQVHPLATQAVSHPNDFIRSVGVTCSETCDPENEINAGLLMVCDLVAH